MLLLEANLGKGVLMAVNTECFIFPDVFVQPEELVQGGRRKVKQTQVSFGSLLINAIK